MSTVQLTTDHETIKTWAKERNGKAAQVEGTGDGDPGVLRIEFPDAGKADSLKRIQWPSFFKKFDEQGLALLYQDQTERGEISRFCKLVYAPQGVLAMLHEEHEKVLRTLASMEDTTPNAVKTRPRLLEQLEELLIPHMAGEKKVVYKALKQAATDNEETRTVLEAREEHRLAKQELKRLAKADPETPAWGARLKVLKEVVEHHIEEEEEEMFDLARNLLGEEQLEELDQQYRKREQKALAKL
ncbi:MAG: hemerythrin domain-containing protein [Phycisphaerae bacterium]